MQHDGSNGARARSARIRAAHDYEANRLESMRRDATQHEPHVSLVARLASALGRARRWNADPMQGLGVDTQSELVVDPSPND